MDLRYLEFLLSFYSWILVVFCLICILWLVTSNISEIGFGVVKLKFEIATRSIAVILAACIIMAIASEWLTEEIQQEIQMQKSLEYDDTNARTKWLSLWEKITYSSNDATFAFLKIKIKDASYMYRHSYFDIISESIMQNMIIWVIRLFPLIALSLELIAFGYLGIFSAEGRYGIVVMLIIGFSWLPAVQHQLSQLRDVVSDLAVLTLK